MRILVTSPSGYIRDSFLGGEVAKKLHALGDVVWNEGSAQWPKEELRERLAGVDACVTGWGSLPLSADVLEKADALRLVAHTGGTVANLVSEEMFARGIRIVSGNDGYARSVAEGVIAYMLLGLRRLPHFMGEMRETGWVSPHYWNEGLLDQTVGLVGYGSVTAHLIPLLKMFDTRVKLYSSHMKPEEAKALGVELASLEEIMATCKVISLHCASTPKNHHLIDRRLLEMIPEGALLLNTARGDVLDEAALADECGRRAITAVLDVYEKESPLPVDSPLWGHDNILMIPHMCGPTVDQRRVIGRRLAGEIERFFAGEPLTMEISRSAAGRMTR